MKSITSKNLIKRLKTKLTKLNLSFAINGATDWKQIYKLLKLAKKLDDDFKLPRKQLKQAAKDLVNVNGSKEVAETLVVLIDKNIELVEKSFAEKQEYSLVKKANPFVSWFFEKKTVLLI